MFEIKKTEYVNKTFRMPAELVKRLETLAQSNDVSLNNLIIQCCEYAVENLKKQNTEGYYSFGIYMVYIITS